MTTERWLELITLSWNVLFVSRPALILSVCIVHGDVNRCLMSALLVLLSIGIILVNREIKEIWCTAWTMYVNNDHAALHVTLGSAWFNNYLWKVNTDTKLFSFSYLYKFNFCFVFCYSFVNLILILLKDLYAL